MKQSGVLEKASARTKDKTSTSTEISRVAVCAIGIIAGIIGAWAMACIISGISHSGGPTSLLSDLFKAIF